MDNKEYQKAYRARKKKDGMCCTCYSRAAREGKRQCQVCSEKRQLRERARYAKGICGCGKPRDLPNAKCKDCADRAVQWKRDNIKRFRMVTNANNQKKRVQVLEHYGAKCVCCGENGIPFLTLDHINNDGKKDREIAKTGQWWRHVIKSGYPSHLQVLCWNCNMAKHHFGGGTCPHELIRQGLTLQYALKPL